MSFVCDCCNHECPFQPGILRTKLLKNAKVCENCARETVEHIEDGIERTLRERAAEGRE